jgi:hypothetical protein
MTLSLWQVASGAHALFDYTLLEQGERHLVQSFVFFETPARRNWP